MVFSEQLSKLRKEANMTQEDLAEKCDVSRQAVAKWESGESLPDIYKISQIAKLFEVSLEELIWGECQQETQKDMAKKIYVLFAKNMEDLRTCLNCGKLQSDKELATQLRAEIKKSRLVFSKKIVDELMELTIDFAYSTIYMMGREEYKEIFAGETYDRRQIRIYCDVIIPQRYDRIEEILGEYLELP